MIVCQCFRITDRDVRELVRQGARSGVDVGRSCGAGTGCGGCQRTVDEIVAAALGRVCAAPQPSVDLGRRVA